MDDDALARRARRARKVADQLTEAGGIVGQVDLEQRWSLSDATVSRHVARPDFPEPYDHIGRRPVWLAAEVDLWRARFTGRGPGTPSS